jgi:hypothetical protein
MQFIFFKCTAISTELTELITNESISTRLKIFNLVIPSTNKKVVQYDNN